MASGDAAFMRAALALAWGGAGCTGTNPPVGAIVIAGGVEVGRGFHRRIGEDHAELVALDQAGPRARGATLYVTLEPCVHHGRTPPCIERILDAGVARVVVPALDPDERVSGRGVAALRERGVVVDTGCLHDAAVTDLLWYYRHRLGLAGTVTLKVAVSQDGRVTRARGQRDDVSGEVARREVHALRAVHDVVVVGVETALVDRPRLDCRLLEHGVDAVPVPAVLDSGLRLPLDNEWARAGRPYVLLTGPHVPAARARAHEAAGARVVACAAGAGGVDIASALAALAGAGYGRVLVEGGPRVLASVQEAGGWDAAWVYRSDEVFGGDAPTFVFDERGAQRVDEHRVGSVTRTRYLRDASWEHVRTALTARTRV